MASGALLLDSSKADDPVKVFFRKRAARLLLPFIFWAIIYIIYRVYVNQEIIPLNFNSVQNNLVNGFPAYHFWFLYLLVGLYLLTPLLRVFIAHASRNVIKYSKAVLNYQVLYIVVAFRTQRL